MTLETRSHLLAALQWFHSWLVKMLWYLLWGEKHVMLLSWTLQLLLITNSAQQHFLQTSSHCILLFLWHLFPRVFSLRSFRSHLPLKTHLLKHWFRDIDHILLHNFYQLLYKILFLCTALMEYVCVSVSTPRHPSSKLIAANIWVFNSAAQNWAGNVFFKAVVRPQGISRRSTCLLLGNLNAPLKSVSVKEWQPQAKSSVNTGLLGMKMFHDKQEEEGEKTFTVHFISLLAALKLCTFSNPHCCSAQITSLQKKDKDTGANGPL